MTLRKVVLVLPLLLSAFFTSAETYVLDIEQLKTTLDNFQLTKNGNSYNGKFTDDSFEWCIDISTRVEVSSKLNNRIYNGHLWSQAGNANKISHVTLSTSSLINCRLSKVSVEATMRNALDTDTEQTFVITLSDTIFNKVLPIYSGALKGDIAPVEISFGSETIQDSLAIHFYATAGGDFILRNITIDYESFPAPVVDLHETIPVGHVMELTADMPDAIIYYSFDNGEDWQEYDASTGVVFSTAGTYGFKYYGESADGLAQSEVTTESIEVVQPKGIAALVAASADIEVSGIICGHADEYVLIGADNSRS